ncbi:Imm42 family immunity protein [Mangrovivirga cuniculi]|uniref:Uncharacterized protein n=1 Tax=Mangrovivirga cuniculi TaxID=2715131 RepID=A0A4D7JGG1_9BACT|nr:Imm42 family immunity protein [Mangrovivirga cuniculi]QCK14193.1 hypothetical protein DCC35_05260 [Mangrovivirga cuniculi]
MVIGNPNSFAIKSEVTKNTNFTFGKVELILDNFKIGYYDEEVIIGSFIHQLNKLKFLPVLQLKFENDLEGLINKVYQNEDGEYDYTMLSLTESFDDFLIRAFRVEDEICIIWQLYEDPFHNYPNQGEMSKLHLKKVKLDEFLNFIDEFSDWYESHN